MNTDCFSDRYGNFCKLSSLLLEYSYLHYVRILSVADADGKGGEHIFALPVKKMLSDGKEYSKSGIIVKAPGEYADRYERPLWFSISDDLRMADAGDAGYLLDKDGNHIQRLSDFDHAFDADGVEYFPVPESDLRTVSGKSGDFARRVNVLTKEAALRWGQKFGIEPAPGAAVSGTKNMEVKQ